MTNHVHLLLTPPQPQDVPRLIISLGRRYVQYINKTYRRTGTLWDSRYKSSLVQVDRYLLLCQRYIELNPVRAAMVDNPAHYRWSSYRANALGQEDALVTPHPLYTDIAVDETLRQASYRSLFRHALDTEALSDIRLALGQCQPLGNARFMDAIEQMTGQRREAKPRGKPREEANNNLSLAPFSHGSTGPVAVHKVIATTTGTGTTTTWVLSMPLPTTPAPSSSV